jgi:hypothetical protein
VGKCKLTDLKGLGKHIWKGIDAQEYVNELRGKDVSTKMKNMTKQNIFNVLLTTYISEVYTDNPQHLSDDDLEKLANAVYDKFCSLRKKLTKAQYIKLAEMIRRA